MGISTSTERLAGYRMELELAGVPFDPGARGGQSRLEDGWQATSQLLELPERPSALVVGNNLMTIGAVGAIEELGLRVPR